MSRIESQQPRRRSTSGLSNILVVPPITAIGLIFVLALQEKIDIDLSGFWNILKEGGPTAIGEFLNIAGGLIAASIILISQTRDKVIDILNRVVDRYYLGREIPIDQEIEVPKTKSRWWHALTYLIVILGYIIFSLVIVRGFYYDKPSAVPLSLLVLTRF